MEKDFKVQDCVRLIHGYTPDMTISDIDESAKTAKCFWYDTKTKKMQSDILPLSVLKHCPEKATVEEIRSAFGR